MGLSKEMDTQFGVSVSYWNIGSLMYNKRTNTLHALLYGYVSHDARIAGATPLLEREFDFPTTGAGATVIDLAGKDPLAAAYIILTTVKVTDDTIETPVETPFSPEFYGAPMA